MLKNEKKRDTWKGGVMRTKNLRGRVTQGKENPKETLKQGGVDPPTDHREKTYHIGRT